MSQSSKLMVARSLKLGSDGIGSRRDAIELFRAKFLIVALSFGATLLSGCTVVFTNPPTKSHRVGVNRQLLGKWTGQDEKGNRGFIQFDKSSNTEINVSIFGEKGDLGYQNPVFTMITKKIGTYNYMVLNATESSAPPGYVIARFSIVHGKLKVWTLSVQRIKEAIKNGVLKGTDVGGPFGSVTITNSSQEIATLLKSAKSEALFVSFGEFHLGESFAYRNLYVADGSIMPGPVGHNPSKTIAALSERIVESIVKEGR